MGQCHRKGVSGKRVAGAIRSLQLEYTRVLRETLLVPVFIYGNETMIQKVKERSRIGLYR